MMVDAILFILGWTMAILCFCTVVLAIWATGDAAHHAALTAWLFGITSGACFIGYGITKI